MTIYYVTKSLHKKLRKVTKFLLRNFFVCPTKDVEKLRNHYIFFYVTWHEEFRVQGEWLTWPRWTSFTIIVWVGNRYDLAFIERLTYHDSLVGVAWFLARDLPVLVAAAFGSSNLWDKYALTFYDDQAGIGFQLVLRARRLPDHQNKIWHSGGIS